MLDTNVNNKFGKEGLTFDDVLLIPGESDCTPDMVDIHTHLTKDIVLNTPIMTSAMDTVTESKMAIAIAREGGIGIIHKNMTIAQQKKQVDKKKYMRKLYPWLLGMILGIMPCIVSASENDSIKVESLLQKAARLPADSCRILFFAQNLLGVPYVANTLDGTDEERLVVHLDKVDCTTLVETVLALSLADKYGKSDFESYKKALLCIRYRNGKQAGYVSRLHYFSDWIKDNEQKGIVHERTGELGLAVSQILNLDFMSTHSDNYHRLKNNPSMISQMIEIERKWKNVPVSYIPKTSLNVSSEELDIKNGDIIAITTNIKGLDVVHTGFACWVDGKLHLLHASSVMKKVILDSQTLFEYSKNKKAHTGVRVISFSSLKP